MPAELPCPQKAQVKKLLISWRSSTDGEMEANYLWLPHLSSEKCQVPGDGDPLQHVPRPLQRPPCPGHAARGGEAAGSEGRHFLQQRI